MKLNGKDFSVMEVTFNHVCALEDIVIDKKKITRDGHKYI